MERSDLYFGYRNNIDIVPIKEINYIDENIIPRTTTDDVVRKIVSKMPVTTRPFIVFDVCGGIGEYALAFGDNQNVKSVYTFEDKPEYNQVLNKNVTDYNFNSKIGVGNKFGSLPDDFGGSVVFISCPVIEGGELKLNNYSIEQWLNALNQMALIVIKVPDGYNLKSVQGFIYEPEDIRGNRFIFATSDRGMIKAEKQGLINYQKMAQEKIEQLNSIEWLSQLQVYIYNLLERIIPEAQDRIPYLTEEPMKIWTKAFTHETFDRDFNYEQLETLGDRALEFVFTRYLTKRFPDITSEQITQLKREYMSKVKQAELARNILKVTPYIRHLGLNITPSMYEDVFESIFGAIFDISDRFIKEGLGYVNAYNMIVSLFDEMGIDFKLAKEGDKSTVNIRFSKMNWGQKPIEIPESTPTGSRVVVRLTESAIAWFKDRGIDINPIIGVGEARIQNVAEKIAYKQAIDTLNRLGITPDKITDEREKSMARDTRYSAYLGRVKTKLRSMGFEEFEFFSSKTSAAFGAYLVQLYGIPREGRKKLLLSTLATSDEQGHERLLKDFAESN